MDLGELWRSRQWRKLLSLIDQLPGTSRLSEAIARDPEHVEQILEAQERAKAAGEAAPQGPRLVDYTPTVERLDQIIEALQSNTRAVLAAGGAKPNNLPKFVPQPRPVTAYDHVQHQRRLAQHESLTRRILRR